LGFPGSYLAAETQLCLYITKPGDCRSLDLLAMRLFCKWVPAWGASSLSAK
jgi:hypothetical protein